MIAALLVGLLGGCSTASGGPTTDPGMASVASVPTSAGAAARPTTAAPVATADGPLIRADTTGEEIERYLVLWEACLTAQGVPGITKQNAAKPDLERFAKYPKALAACASKRPEQVIDRYKRQHPQAFQAHLRQFIKCMKNAGQKIIFIPPDGWGVTDEQAAAGMNLDNSKIKRCESKAYGSGT